MEDFLSLKSVNAFLIGLTFLSLGLLVGFSHDSGPQSSAEETLDIYPIDISNADIHRHDKQFVQENRPSVDLEAHRDEMLQSHFNLEIKTQNFEFAPENISQDHVPNKGHAHVYVDDVLVSRSYGNWYHLPRLDPGNHTIRVTLNANNHNEYESEKGVIQDEVVVNVPEN